jgi:hypothetical protein
VQTFLDETFAARWIGNGGPISCPLFCPDITPLAFFLWQYVKDYVYRTSVDDIATVPAQIIKSICSVLYGC